jgi:hypothetical protein
MQNQMATSSMLPSSMSGAGAAAAGGSSFYLSLDGTGIRHPGQIPNTLNKAAREDDEEDKDKERYMPAILLSTPSGSKVQRGCMNFYCFS